MKRVKKVPLRHAVLVLGDQLDANSSAFDGFDPEQDVVWMAEVSAESDHVWSSQPRITVFLSAMRHFRESLRTLGRRVDYVELEDPSNTQSLDGELRRLVATCAPAGLIVTEPGEWRVRTALEEAARAVACPLEIREDRHFLCTAGQFRAHAEGRKQLRMEFFYREMRRQHQVLLDAQGEPEGGEWNLDHQNRGSFGREGPGVVTQPLSFHPDEITRSVVTLVQRRFADRPGHLEKFDWPVTAEEARLALDDFIEHRLAFFGRYQDAMWTGEPWLYHSRLASAMNLKLLDPRTVIAEAEKAYRTGRAALADVEGFIRQILGWREYVRAIYWMHMPGYLDRNALEAKESLPEFYWTGDTRMSCLRSALRQTLDLGYAHHIQRLMVTGLYPLLLGVDPREVHVWYLAVYVDAIEWVELPNTLGMSQYADGGIMASKPYIATGRYIKRMSNACETCVFDPEKSTGEQACPFTTLYWDFLLTHEERMAANPRMLLQVKNLARLGSKERVALRARAADIRKHGGQPPESAGQKLFPLT